jgi:hypothetical protein
MGHNIKNPSDPPTYRDAENALKRLRSVLEQSHPDALAATLKLIYMLIDKDRGVVLYLGSGCNVDVRETPSEGYKRLVSLTWVDLLKRLFDKLPRPSQQKLLQAHARRASKVWQARPKLGFEHLLRGGEMDRLHLAWLLTNHLGGPVARDKEIVKLVEPSGSASSESELYDAVLTLPFDDIVTTNYDSYIPRFLKVRQERRSARPEKKGAGPPAGHAHGFEEIVNITDDLARASKREGVPRIFYLHGRAKVSRRLIFDRFDYAEMLMQRDGMLDYVTHLLRDAHVIYVGFGLDDLTFNQMETRLHALHPAGRSLSFAFLPVVTEEERKVWQARDLEIIDYGDHRQVPDILRCVNIVRQFVNTAEPDRPNREAFEPDDDRTEVYWRKALELYVGGDFEGSWLKARAALASTLFWKRESGPQGHDRLTPFERAVRLCDIRIRLALNHYKLRWGKDKREHEELVKVNVEAADELITALKSRPAEWRAVAADKRVLLALENSLDILKARDEYHRGKFLIARSRYMKVVGSVRGEEIRARVRDERAKVITKLRLAEGVYYARCQLSRLEYQFIDRAASDRRKERLRRVNEMLAVAREADKLCEFLGTKERTCRRFPEWEYFLNSLSVIRSIAMWTAGRHAVRVCQDLIPTREERVPGIYDELSRALDYLKVSPGEAEAGNRNASRRLLWKVSPHWPVLRSRYQCRGYALRWLVGQQLNRPECDGYIIKAFQAIQKAFAQTRGRGLERQQVVNLLEAARLNILAMFGEKKRREQNRQIQIASPLTIGAGLYYLDRAFSVLTPQQTRETSNKWLLALAYRLASYLALVAGDGLRHELEEVKSKELKKFLSRGADKMVEEVAEHYRQFAEELADGHAFDQRINYYTATFNSIRDELSVT